MDDIVERIVGAILAISMVLGVLAICTMMIVGAVAAVVWLGRALM